jgi:hypothetical protein
LSSGASDTAVFRFRTCRKFRINPADAEAPGYVHERVRRHFDTSMR